ncbi:dCTP deaminase/dUTPase family protein [Aliarcobacter cibarius]|uniref:Uncharacterized protein n=1 Tax=Aliarcobacter cibarius TaxID=255507 RepID=A0ABY2V4M8_9BACT|nr:hypothetical protein [Aliarcobacter cibarius]TLS99907.1 hypothetical protein FE247_05090 [Aliarcobacter cibarius]TLT00316.1 hypothetical protein FE245_05520 [Aliarcobacter cibarius]
MFKILKDYCTPKRGTKYSAYVDLFSAEDVIIGAGETKVIKLGVKLDLEEIINSNDEVYNNPDKFLKSHYLEVALRNSLGVKGLIISDGIEIIDLDYPDEIGLIVHNPMKNNTLCAYQDGTIGIDIYNDNTFLFIKKGDKVAQCTLKEHKGYLMGYETETLRTGGFGSTDKKTDTPIFDKPDFFKSNELN